MSQAASLNIAVETDEDRDAYQAFEMELRQVVAAHPEIRITPYQANNQEVDLIVAIGSKAAARFADSPVPVLNVMVSRSGMTALHRSAHRSYSDIYMDQPVARQLALLRSAVPDAKTIGVLVSQENAELASIRQMTVGHGMKLHVQGVVEPGLISSELSALLVKSDVLLVLPDALVYRPDTIRNILLETYRHRVPVIGLSQNYVRAGALCAVYSTPAQIARQAAELLGQFSRTRKLPKYQYPQEFEVAVNKQVARSLGLTIKSAEQMREEIEGRP